MLPMLWRYYLLPLIALGVNHSVRTLTVQYRPAANILNILRTSVRNNYVNYGHGTVMPYICFQ